MTRAAKRSRGSISPSSAPTTSKRVKRTRGGGKNDDEEGVDVDEEENDDNEEKADGEGGEELEIKDEGGKLTPSDPSSTSQTPNESAPEVQQQQVRGARLR